jgi:hypothetical protein
MKKWLYKAGAGVAGVVFVASAITLFAPKAVHAVVSALVTVANTPANPVPTQAVKESRVNFISVSFVLGGSTYNEASPDGTISSTPFTIPSGEQFVITDVNWLAVCVSSFNGVLCNKSVGDSTILVLGGGGSFPAGSYASQGIYADLGGLLIAGRSDSLKSGLVVTQLPLPSVGLFGPGNGEEILAVNLRGYLVP